jgi:hypothetical protein
MRRIRAGLLVIVAGTLLLLAGCHNGTAAGSAGARSPSPAPAAGSTDPAPQLDDVETALNRIERELDTDAGR